MTATRNHEYRTEVWKGATLPDLQVERDPERGTYWLNQQQGLQDPIGVEVHPDQVRYLAERMDVVEHLAADESVARKALQDRIRELEKDQRRLRLALLACQDRTEQLFENLVQQHERGHEDLSIEVAKAAALADILDLACADFEDEFGVVDEADSKRVYPPTTAEQDRRTRNSPVFPMKAPQISQGTPPNLGALKGSKPAAGDLFAGGKE